jgi:hypothetical protein
MVFGLIAGTTMLVVAITVGSTSAPGLIDDPEVVSVIERECQQMTASVESLPIHGTPRRQAQTIARQNVAIEDMVADIREVGQDALASDPPTDEWLADWERLVEARAAYADHLLAGSVVPFSIPYDEDGQQISVRMDDVFIDSSVCEVPEVLVKPYPDGGSEA